MTETLAGLGRARAIALALSAGVLYGVSFPPLGAWPLTFVALAPLIVATRGRRSIEGGVLGWITGTVAAAIAVVPWIAAAARDYFAQGPLTSVGFAACVSQVFGVLPVVVFGALLPGVARLGSAPARVLTAAAAWTGLEVVRTHAFGGAPWDLLAHALYAQPRWIQIADLGGAFAVSFVVMAINAAVAEVTVRPRRAAVQAGATAGILALLTVAYGTARLADVRDEGPPTLRLALVQGNVDNAWRVDAARADDAFRVFADLTRGVMGERPRLVVWPENAVSFLLEPNPRFGRAVAGVLAHADAWLLLGGPRFAQTGDGSARFHNSAHLLASSGEQQQVYDKRHLVPFAEYAPLPSVPWLGWRFDAPGDYTPGDGATVFEQPVPFGVLICFEVIYPELARDLVRSGAQLLLNISNDAWFGNSAGLEQHFAMSVFRAVETRRALARAANTGVTGLIGPSGQVLARFPTGVPGAWVVTAPVRDDESVYVRAGDTFAWGMGLVAVVVLLGRRRRRDT